MVLMTKVIKSYSWKNSYLFISKIAVRLSLGIHEGRPSYRRSLQRSVESIKLFKTWNVFLFFSFSGSFLPSRTRIQKTKIRIHNTDFKRRSFNFLSFVQICWKTYCESFDGLGLHVKVPNLDGQVVSAHRTAWIIIKYTVYRFRNLWRHRKKNRKQQIPKT